MAVLLLNLFNGEKSCLAPMIFLKINIFFVEELHQLYVLPV